MTAEEHTAHHDQESNPDQVAHLLEQLTTMLQQLVVTQQQIAITQQQLATTQQQIATLLEHLVTRSIQPQRPQSDAAPAETVATSIPVDQELVQPQTTPVIPTMRPAASSAHVPLEFIAEQDATQRIILQPNGINGATGQPLLRIDAAAARALAHDDHEPEARWGLYKAKQEQAKQHLGPVFGVNEDKLEESLWAVIVNGDDDAAILKALRPLIQHRSRQQNLTPPELTFRADETCAAWLARHVADIKAPLKSHVPVLLYNPGDTCSAWLARYGVSHGAVDPKRGVPFYLVLAARPGPLNARDTAFIPFSFQYELDMFWGVGRLCFSDTTGQHDLAAYSAYAEQVVQFEQAAPPYRKHAVFFGTRHDLDLSTEQSAAELVTPLAHGHDNQPGIAQRWGFDQRVLLQQEATKANLAALLRGEVDGGPPALLFTATHGIGLPADDPRLLMHQGALLCQDWAGFGNIKREQWFAAEDLTEQTRVAGLVAVCFACYGAGCPHEDEFIFNPDKTRPRIAPYPFIAQLPQHLLKRGALAVLGHVERAWTHSFSSPDAPKQSQAFEDLLARILNGKRLGFATDQFNLRQGVLSSRLADEIENMAFHKTIKPEALGPLWVARNDARNYALLGDPAVRLPIEQMVGGQ